jgi:hypothetical protein
MNQLVFHPLFTNPSTKPGQDQIIQSSPKIVTAGQESDCVWIPLWQKSSTSVRAHETT